MLFGYKKYLGLLLAIGMVLPLKGDELVLKSQAAIRGNILIEKPDQVVIDLGYTVLSVPRSQIADLKRKKDPADEDQTPVPALTKKGLYFASTRAVEQPVRDWVGQIGEAVVQVRTPGALGSGFFINEEGYLITNFHVIEGETQISVEVYQQKPGQFERKTYKKVRIVAMNKFQDLALLQVEDPPATKFAVVSLGDSDALSVGERVFAIGSPLGLERTVTEGIISTKTREVQGELYLQTTAQINPGNSGGPLFNLRGEVVGVTSMKVAYGEGIGFAIPVERVIHFLNHREAFAYENDNPNNPYRYLDPPSRQQQTK